MPGLLVYIYISWHISANASTHFFYYSSKNRCLKVCIKLLKTVLGTVLKIVSAKFGIWKKHGLYMVPESMQTWQTVDIDGLWKGFSTVFSRSLERKLLTLHVINSMFITSITCYGSAEGYVDNMTITWSMNLITHKCKYYRWKLWNVSTPFIIIGIKTDFLKKFSII